MSARALAGRLLLFVGTLAVGLTTLELGLRAAGVAEPLPATPLSLPGLTDTGQPFSHPDELLIYSITPHAKTYDWFQIDRHGFRTPEFADSKTPGTLRIVVTGDSTTFGLGVLEEQRWSSVLRSVLQGLCADVQPIEVINAGVPGYSTLQNRLQIQRDLLALEPDLLILLVTAGNDTTLVEGPGDAEIVAVRNSLRGRLADLRIARLLGSRPEQYGAPPPRAATGSTTARPRVSVPEVRENLNAIVDMLPGRVVFGVFESQAQRTATEGQVDAVTDEVARVAQERGVPFADARPAIEALLPYPLYLDSVHPTAVGHEVIATEMLEAALQILPLPPASRGWARGLLAARRRPEPGWAAPELQGPGPARFAELVAFYEHDDIDVLLQARAGGLPPSLLEWDPILGQRCAARSVISFDPVDTFHPLGLRSPQQTLAEVVEFIRPMDPLWSVIEGRQHAAIDRRARTAVVYLAEIGLPPRRLDIRRGLAEQAPDPAAAIALLDAVLALDPGDDEARYDRAFRLRRAGRGAEAREEFKTLAAGTGPLADFARGLLAHQAHDLPAAEAALRAAIAAAPSLGYAHDLLGRVCLEQERFDEAAREIMLGAVMLGSVASLPAELAAIEAKRQAAAAR